MDYQSKVDSVVATLSAIKIIPVLAVEDASHAKALGNTLVENGLPCAEVTFRTSAAVDVMKIMKTQCPDLVVGAGTVLTTEQVDLAIEAGCDFGVSPGLNPEIVKYAQSKGLPFIPGINNPSLVEQAMSLGLTTVKFFPAEPSGGTSMLKALQAVYPVQFMPTGGVNVKNANDYLSMEKVFCCGGTWMVPTDLIEAQNWEAIGELTQAAAELVAK
jgi:2-dehydro-3-deoxyphosphogluconate aldolase/(4S)-4-hydroxy-2-oxoglutarate aldolase